MTTKQTKLLLAGLLLLWLIVAIVLMSKPPDYNAFTNESEAVVEVTPNTTVELETLVTATPITPEPVITPTPRQTQDVINCALPENQNNQECSPRSSSMDRTTQSSNIPEPSPTITPLPTPIPEFPWFPVAIISTIVLLHFSMKKRGG